MVIFLYSERRYFSGESEAPEQLSFIINSSSNYLNGFSCGFCMKFKFLQFYFKVTVMFHIALLFCSLLGVFSSFGLFIGILIDCKELLLPWIFTMIVDCFAEISHFIYIAVFVDVRFSEKFHNFKKPLNFIGLSFFCLDIKMKFNVSTALIFTLDVFIQTINVSISNGILNSFLKFPFGSFTVYLS
jgi:hypothetical protein